MDILCRTRYAVFWGDSMKKPFLEGGQIVNTHGIKGEVKVVSWCDTPETLAGVPVYHIDGAPRKVRAARVHQGNVLALLEGVEDVNAAMLLKGKTVLLRREDLPAPPGGYFLADLLGLAVVDAATGERLGELSDILFPSSQSVYVVKGEREWMIPAVPEFIESVDVDGGFMKVNLIEGM